MNLRRGEKERRYAYGRRGDSKVGGSATASPFHPRSFSQTERGQAIVLFAIVLSVTTLFALGIIDYMVTNTRVMETVAAADLAAHAGAQYIVVYPDGSLETDNGQAENVVVGYFGVQAPEGAVLSSVNCTLIENRPACQVSASVQSAGILIPQRWITVSTTGYLAYGVTEDDQ